MKSGEGGARIKLLAIIGFLAVAIAVLDVRTSPVPTASWINLHTTYPIFWLCLFLATTIGAVLSFHRGREMFAIGLVFLVALSVVSVTFIWNVPFGPRDPWVHLNRIAEHRFTLEENIYPGSHLAGAILVEILGISAMDLMVRATAAVTALGILALFVTLRTYISTKEATITIMAAAPAVLFIRARPFSLAWALLPIALFTLFKIINSGRVRKQYMYILGVVAVATLIIHPFVFFILTVITVISSAVIAVLHELRNQGKLAEIAGEQGLGVIPVLFGTLLTLYIVFLTDIGTEALAGVLLGFFEVDSGGQSIEGPGQIALMFSDWQHFFQGLVRMGHIILLGLLASLAVLVQVSDRRPQTPSILMYVCAGIMGVTMIGLSLFGVERVGLTRVFLIVPLLLAVSIPPLFSRKSGIRAGALAALVLFAAVAGGLAAYGTTTIGDSEISSNQKHVSTIDHLENHRGDSPVIGGRISFYVIEGHVGNDAIYDWSPGGINGKYLTAVRPVEYAWFVRDAPSHSLYIVEGADKILSERRSQQLTGDDHACMVEFVDQNNHIYTNGQDEILKHSNKAGAVCI